MARTPSKKRRKDGRFRVTVGTVAFYSTVSWADANRQAQAYRRELDSGLNADARATTLRAYALRWLPVHKAGVKDKTYNEYAGLINRMLTLIGDEPLMHITPDKALSAFIAAFPPKRTVGSEGYSGSTMKRAKMLMRDIFDSAIENGYATKNPFRSEKFKPTMGKDGTHREITDEERTLIHTVQHPFRPAVMAMLYAGLRRGEVLAINTDTDIHNGFIHVANAVTYPGNQPDIGNPKTDNAYRDVPIFPPLAEELKHITGLIAPSVKSSSHMSESAFRSAWNSYISTVERHINGVQKRWYGLRHEDQQRNPSRYAVVQSFLQAGEKEKADELRLTDWISFDIRPHDLRHSFCTMCRDAGVDIKQTIEWMGHADEKMILKIYDHVTTRRSSESIKKVTEFLNSESDLGQNMGQTTNNAPQSRHF